MSTTAASKDLQPQPISVACTTPSGQLVAVAANKSLFLYDTSTGSLLCSTAGKENNHTDRLRLLASTNDKLVSTGDDKLLKVWSLPDLSLLSTRSVPKRANTIKITEDAQTVAVGDKFGDVYSYLLDANQELESTGVKEAASSTAKDKDGAEKRQPVLGHVSMLTAMTFNNSAQHGQTLITADRDEHVRVSKWPNGLEIIQYLLGHLKFVSSLLVLENESKLLSAGGEDELYIWDLQSMKLQTKRNIAALRNHLIIPSPRRSGETDARSRNPRRKGNKKGKGGKKGDAAPEKEKEAEEEGQAAEQVEEAGGQTEEGEKALVISNIFPLHHESWIGVTSTGGSAILALNLHSDDCNLLDLQQPILTVATLQGDKLLVTLDSTRSSSSEQPSTLASSAIVSFADGKLTREAASPLTEALAALSTEQATDKTYSTEVLYPELSLLHKDTGSDNLPQEQFMASQAPRTHKPGSEKVKGKAGAGAAAPTDEQSNKRRKQN